MELDLKDKIVLVTGSSRGLGKVIAREYLREGAKVCLVARGRLDLDKTQREFQGLFGRDCAKAVAADLSQEAGIKRCLEVLRRNFNRLDILVANIGSGSGKSGLEPRKEDWENSLRLNLISPALLIQALHGLLKQSQGSIVLISSIAGREAIAAPVPYSVSKLGLQAIAKHYARILAPDLIRVNALCPGNILLPGGLWERKLGENKIQVEGYIASEVPLRRFATGEEVAHAALFLSSPRASFITGSTLVVDGGQTRAFL